MDFFFKDSKFTKSEANQTEQSSYTDEKNLTNKYMQELNTKLKNEELKSLQEMLKRQKEAEVNSKIVKPTVDDWSQINPEKQIQNHESSREITESNDNKNFQKDKSNPFAGIVINEANAKDFILTARKNGYHVVLSKTYEIISVTPIVDLQNKKMNDVFEANPPE